MTGPSISKLSFNKPIHHLYPGGSRHYKNHLYSGGSRSTIIIARNRSILKTHSQCPFSSSYAILVDYILENKETVLKKMMLAGIIFSVFVSVTVRTTLCYQCNNRPTDVQTKIIKHNIYWVSNLLNWTILFITSIYVRNPSSPWGVLGGLSPFHSAIIVHI